MSSVEDKADNELDTWVDAEVINGVAKECAQIAEDHGFHDVVFSNEDAHMFARLALITSEVSEALDVYRSKKYEDGLRDERTLMTLKQTEDFVSELADIVIRTFDLAASNHWALGTAILNKMEKNRGRHRLHGKAF